MPQFETVWQRGHQRYVDIKIAETPKYAIALARVLKWLNEGKYNEEYVNSLVQTASKSYDLYDAAIFLRMHTAMVKGDIIFTTIHFGETPCADRAITENIRKLAKLSDTRFFSVDKKGKRREEELHIEATFEGGSQSDYDGVLSWNGPLELGTTKGAACIVADGFMPLEVGYTYAERTFGHLANERSLARWPYGSEKIWLFQVVNNDLWNVRFKTIEKMAFPEPEPENEGIVEIEQKPVYAQLPMFLNL